MRFNEFMPSSYIKEDSADGEDLAASIATMLQFLRQRASVDGSSPSIKTSSFISLVQKAGHESFCYQDLVVANSSPLVKNLVKSFNKDSITLRTENDEEADIADNDVPAETEQETTVSQMAKRASGI